LKITLKAEPLNLINKFILKHIKYFDGHNHGHTKKSFDKLFEGLQDNTSSSAELGGYVIEFVNRMVDAGLPQDALFFMISVNSRIEQPLLLKEEAKL
jgi:hypothetical protein